MIDRQSMIDNESLLDKEYMDNLTARFERLSKENYIKSRQNNPQEQRLSKSYEDKIDIRENCQLNKTAPSVKTSAPSVKPSAPSAPVEPNKYDKDPPSSPPKYQDQDEYGYNNNHRISLYPKIDNESIY